MKLEKTNIIYSKRLNFIILALAIMSVLYKTMRQNKLIIVYLGRETGDHLFLLTS